MKKNKYKLLGGAAVILISIIAAMLLFGRSRSPERGKKDPAIETKQDRKEDMEVESESSTEDGREKEEDKEELSVYGLGRIYYLAPDKEEEFKDRLGSFMNKQKIEAVSAIVLEHHVDDRSDEKEPAEFFIQANDDAGSVIRILFDKTTGACSFSLLTQNERDFVSDSLDGGGSTEYEIPESMEDEETSASPVKITDQEDTLREVADLDELIAALEDFLKKEEEGRRNFFVDSVAGTEKGYEAVLGFETVRLDGRSIKVVYDGSYLFRFE